MNEKLQNQVAEMKKQTASITIRLHKVKRPV